MYTEKEEAVLEILGDKPLTRDEMVRKLKLPRTTIYDVLKKLIEQGDVKNFRKKEDLCRGASKSYFGLTETVDAVLEENPEIKNTVNDNKVLESLKGRVLTRAGLSKASEVPYGTVYSCLERLLEKGLITEKKEIIKDRTISYYRLAG